MTTRSYVLVTPVKDEEKTIEITIQSVINQTVLPLEWVIVSDESTDSTDEIIEGYAKRYKFINLIRVTGNRERSFASVVHVTEAGVKAIKSRDYDYIGLLDGDVRFSPEYFEALIGRFAKDPRLGLAGGFVRDNVRRRVIRGRQYMKNVAGATQFFRRECFESLGGLVAIPEGGWDAITCVVARAKGFGTATFPELIVEHLKPRNASEGNAISRKWQLGIRQYALGQHPLFVVLKCLSSPLEPPVIIAATVRLASFVWCYVAGRQRVIDSELMHMMRNEQLGRILPRFLSRKKVGQAMGSQKTL